MPTHAWENLDDFLSPDDFADLATFTTADGQVIKGVPGIFDDAVLNAETGEYDVAVSQPRFTCAATSVATLKKHDTATIAGKVFLLDHDPHTDGTGMATLELSPDFGS